MSTGLKSIKGGKTENEFYEEYITLRGVEYTIREASVTEYKDALKAVTKNGFAPFQDLLDTLVIMCVSPSPAARKVPMPYPVYRTLEEIVNNMHFVTLKDEKAKPTPEGEEAAEEEAEEVAEAADPNS